MKALALLCSIAVVGFILFVALVTKAERSSVTYATFQDAARAGALGDGMWLPEALPKSAIAIQETHDVDTNEVWFTYDSSAPAIPNGCQQIAWKEVSLPDRGRSQRRFLQNVERLSGESEVHFCQGDEYTYFLTYDHKRGRAYAWSGNVTRD